MSVQLRPTAIKQFILLFFLVTHYPLIFSIDISVAGLRDCALCPEIIQVPKGSMEIGEQLNSADGVFNEGPPRLVAFTNFYIGRNEITQKDWLSYQKSMGLSVKRAANRGIKCPALPNSCQNAKNSKNVNCKSIELMGDINLPMVCVSHTDIQGYLQWLSKLTGFRYRLPSESEWEYVAKLSYERQIAAVNVEPISKKQINTWPIASSFQGNFFGLGETDPYVTAAPIGRYEPAHIAVKDLFGNVWEWTDDCRHDRLYGAPKDGVAWTVDGDCSFRVIRGGSWRTIKSEFRGTERLFEKIDRRYDELGFRVARDLQ